MVQLRSLKFKLRMITWNNMLNQQELMRLVSLDTVLQSVLMFTSFHVIASYTLYFVMHNNSLVIVL